MENDQALAAISEMLLFSFPVVLFTWKLII